MNAEQLTTSGIFVCLCNYLCVSTHGFMTVYWASNTFGRISLERYSAEQQPACLMNWCWTPCPALWTWCLHSDILNSSDFTMTSAVKKQMFHLCFSEFQHFTVLKNDSSLLILFVSPSPSPRLFWSFFGHSALLLLRSCFLARGGWNSGSICGTKPFFHTEH